MTIATRAWVKRNLGFDPAATPAPASTFATVSAAIKSAQPQDFQREIIDFDALVRYGMISPEDVNLFQFADDPTTALKLLQAGMEREPETEEKKPAVAHSHTAEG